MITTFKEIVEKEAIAFNKKYNNFLSKLIELEQSISYDSNLNIDSFYEMKRIQSALNRVQKIDADVMFASAIYALQSITENDGNFPHNLSVNIIYINQTLVFLFRGVFLKELLQCSDSYEYHPETPRMIYI